jgi:wyosine [tRNA(Phe)-imidazoG37] synthetase (radical SAM superfamily)
MKYLFGPVNSRRLGISQGIDLLPPKICNFNCIYCEVGPTRQLTCERRQYVPTEEIIREIDQLLEDRALVDRLDVFTITASGEPTLHTGIGTIIDHLKNHAAKPVAVLTNGSLLHLADVRRDLANADIIIPSLDSAREESFRRINRPAGCAPLAGLIDGLIEFRKGFQGEMWLEILLAKGINDSPEDIDALVRTVMKIKPDRVQLNTVARPPLEKFALPLERQELEAVASRFPLPVEILVDFSTRKKEKFRSASADEIILMLKRRPCTAADVSEALGLDTDLAATRLTEMADTNLIVKTKHHGKEYYQVPE